MLDIKHMISEAKSPFYGLISRLNTESIADLEYRSVGIIQTEYKEKKKDGKTKKSIQKPGDNIKYPNI